MAQNEPQRKKTPLGPSPNSPSLLFEYQRRSGKFIRLANRIESKLFCPYWNAILLRLLRITVRNQRIRRSTVDTSTDDSWAPFGGSLLIDFLVVSRAKHFLINYFWRHRRRQKNKTVDLGPCMETNIGHFSPSPEHVPPPRKSLSQNLPPP